MTYRERYLSQNEEVCAVCGSEEDIDVHHIDGDRSNNGLDNLTALCVRCHGKVHHSLNIDGQLADLQSKLSDPPQPSEPSDTLTATTVRMEADELNELDAEFDVMGFSNRAEYLRWIIRNRDEQTVFNGGTAELDPEVAETLSDEINDLRERIEQLEDETEE